MRLPGHAAGRAGHCGEEAVSNFAAGAGGDEERGGPVGEAPAQELGAPARLLLVYEFLTNNSLDKILFGDSLLLHSDIQIIIPLALHLSQITYTEL